MTPKKAGFQNNDHKDEKRKGKQSRMKKKSFKQRENTNCQTMFWIICYLEKNKNLTLNIRTIIDSHTSSRVEETVKKGTGN